MHNEDTKVQNPRRNSYAGLTHSTAAGYARTYITLASCTAHARASASSRPSPVSRLFHQYLAYEASFDPPVALHVAAAFRWSRNCAKAADGEL